MPSVSLDGDTISLTAALAGRGKSHLAALATAQVWDVRKEDQTIAGWKALATWPVEQRRNIAGPIRIAYFCDGQVKNITELGIAKQCSPPALPDGTPVP